MKKLLLSIALVVGLSIGAQASPAFTLVSKHHAEGTSISVTPSAAGHLLVVMTAGWQGAIIQNISDGGTNVYVEAQNAKQLGFTMGSFDVESHIFYVASASASAITITPTMGSGFAANVGFMLYEYSYSGTPYQDFSTKASSSSSVTSTAASLTTNTTDELVFTSVMFSAGSSTVPSGYSDAFSSDISFGSNFLNGSDNTDVAATGAHTIAWTIGSGQYVQSAVGFTIATPSYIGHYLNPAGDTLTSFGSGQYGQLGRYQATANGTAVHIGFYTDISGTRCTSGIFADASNYPGALIAGSHGDYFHGGGAGADDWRFQELNTPVPIVISTYYWIGIICDGSKDMYYTLTGGMGYYLLGQTYTNGVLVDPYPGSATAWGVELNMRIEMFNGGGPPPPTFHPHFFLSKYFKRTQ